MKFLTAYDSLFRIPCLLYQLEPDEVIYLQFANVFRVIRGSVEIFGGTFIASSDYHKVTTSSLRGSQPLRAIPQREAVVVPLFSENICEFCNAVCGLSNKNLCNFIQLNLPDLSYTLVAFAEAHTPFGTCCPYQCVSNVPLFPNVIKADSSWSVRADCLIRNIIESSNKEIGYSVMIGGPKLSGKSSFSCYLINSLLSVFDKIVLLDVDLNAPLIGCPNSVSLYIVEAPLIGDVHSLQSQWYRKLLSVYVGSSEPDVNPSLFLAAIGQCWCLYQQLIARALLTAEESTDTIKENIEEASRLLRPFVVPSQALQKGFLLPCVSAETQRVISEWHRGVQINQKGCVKAPLVINGLPWVTGLGWQLTLSILNITWCRAYFELTKTQDVPTTEKKKVKKSKKIKTFQSIVSLESSNKLIEKSCSSGADGFYKELNIPNPFAPIVQQFYGRLPLVVPGTHSFSEVQFLNVKSLVKFELKSTFLKDKNYLCWMRTFNPAYQWILHKFSISDECNKLNSNSYNNLKVFFHDSGNLIGIKNRTLISKYAPKLFQVNLRRKEKPFQIALINGTEMDNVRHIQMLLTGSIVALSTGSGSGESIYTEPKPYDMVTIAYIHSVSQDLTIRFYVPCDVDPARLSKACILTVGYGDTFSPCFGSLHLNYPSVFPDCELISKFQNRFENIEKNTIESLEKQASLHIMVSEHTPFTNEFVFECFKVGHKQSRRRNIPRRCQQKQIRVN